MVVLCVLSISVCWEEGMCCLLFSGIFVFLMLLRIGYG